MGDGDNLRVAIDAMGGDYAPREIVAGALDAIREIEDLEIILVGREDDIRRCIDQEDGQGVDLKRVTIMHTDEVIDNNEDPGLAIRRKKESSMVMALELARSGEADAVISAGNTGALMAGGLLMLGRLSGMKRPALLAELPISEDECVVLMDVGANMDAKPEQLYQYAQIGKIYTQEVLGKPNPRIALLNVGTEENKGNAQVKRAYELIKENKELNFVGNLEAKDLYVDKTDILICDGFVGNVFLKTYEGMARNIFTYFYKGAQRSMGDSPELASAIVDLYANLDESEHGGAVLVGLDGVCIKCHGYSKRRAVTQTLLKRAYPFVNKNTNAKIEEELKQTLKEEQE